MLLRHGETEFIVEGRFQGQAETALTATGRRQAALAGERLARPSGGPTLAPLPVPTGEPLEVAHSPLLRTTQTAQAVANAFGAAGRAAPSLRPEPGIAEIAQGEWEGLHHTAIAARYAERLAGWRQRPVEVWAPGGESLRDVDARVRAALRPILGRLAAEATPGGPPGTSATDRSPVPGYRGAIVAEQPWTLLVGHDGVFKVVLLALLGLPLERFWTFPFVLCGISVVEIRAGRPTLRAHNLADHLAPLAGEEAEAEAEAAQRERTGAL